MATKNVILVLLLLAASQPTWAEEAPAFQTNLSFILDYSGIASGGVDHGTATRWLVETGLDWDLDQAAGIPGARLFAGIQIFRGDNGSDLAGDVQGFSNIDADEFEQFGEIGFEQILREGRLAYKVGRLDANSDFAVVEAGGEFIHSSAGYTPPIHTFPSYPTPVWAANLSLQPADWFSAALGLYDSLLEKCPCKDSMSMFAILEGRFSWNDSGRLVLGVWRDRGKLPGFDGTLRHSHDGWYGILEQPLGPTLDLFLQAGSADLAVAEITSHYAAGFAATGLFRSRPDDTAGFMASRAGLSRVNGFTANETALELFYGFHIGRRLTLKPDLQFIINPSGDPEVEDAVVLSLRLEFAF